VPVILDVIKYEAWELTT